MIVTEQTVREFIGWLSADIPELHKVLVPDLADSWERFKAQSAHGSTTATEPEDQPFSIARRLVWQYLNTLVITSDNIGDIRRSLFLSVDSKWNGWVREMTAGLENQSASHGSAPEATTQE